MNPRISFITITLHTKWLDYSQQLIKKNYPFSKRVVISGNKVRDPLKFLNYVCIMDSESDYTILIDEDCFLTDKSQLNSVITEMDKKEDFVSAGVPDGGVPPRTHNPCACNLFFIIFKTKKIKELIINNKGWENLKFQENFKNITSLENYPFINTEKQYDDFEPYYKFFWLILKNNYKIMYLKAIFNKKYCSTDVYTDSKEKPFLMHMWYARKWSSKTKWVNGLTHKERYEIFEKDFLKPLLT